MLPWIPWHTTDGSRIPIGRFIVILSADHSYFDFGIKSVQNGWFSNIFFICATMRDANAVCADKTKILVSGCKYKTHAAKIPTTVDFPE